jgi:hypothetical protein
MLKKLAGFIALIGLVVPGAPAGAALIPAPVPVVASDNIELLATLPDVGAISTAFDPTRPFMYVNTLNGITVYDISDPELPLPVGVLPMPHFENESMSLGQREDGTTFVLVGIDIYALTPTDATEEPATITAGEAEHVIVVDVTDPGMPEITDQLDTGSSTHTVACLPPDCTYAYTSGAYNGGTWHAIDLTNIKDIKSVEIPIKNVAGSGHQWDLDDAGILWSTGFDGAAGYDVSDPLNPVPVASSDPNGNKGPYNDFILHNSYRPNGDAMEMELEPGPTNETGEQAPGRLVSGSPETASVFDGNVLLVTEEDYASPVCQDGSTSVEGTFSTWYIPYADAQQYNSDNPRNESGQFAKHKGKMTPLDTWNSEVLDTGTPTPAGAFCSAHYFTFHDAGFIAQGWYQQGMRVLDVRNPRDIKQVGYFFTGDTETWHAYWVPERDAQGHVTGADTDIVYTNDVARGIDVLKVTLPTTPPSETEDMKAPILQAWLSPTLRTSKPSARFGYICRIAGTL